VPLGAALLPDQQLGGRILTRSRHGDQEIRARREESLDTQVK
jgi:hypothetical protein